ncbi:proline oxidase [Polychaeton citri CBS 116435]|uniref:Proline dehydrogenase n=1 Tax=Polychaeton citri CBS 116435 TaxID=1314669 RepID=A0A9P4Q0A8_9PEZI|nr:proline oxidase [Polychaeton citri CBS 116435]
MLLRSLLVTTISSKRYLLLPCLSILSFLSRRGRGYLLNVDRNPILHAILMKTFYEQFCAGENKVATSNTVQQLKSLGFQGVILTYARELDFDHRTDTELGVGVTALRQAKAEKAVNPRVERCANIDVWHKGLLETIDLLNEGDFLALKLTGAGPVTTKALATGGKLPKQMLRALDEICETCLDRKVRILIDAESQLVQWGIMSTTVGLMRRFNREGYALVFNTYQAYLKTTRDAVNQHLAAASKYGFTLGLKLVRGAYIGSEERSLIHDTKWETDDAYNGIAHGALRQEIGNFGTKDGQPFPSVDLFLASHNKESILTAHQLHESRVRAGLPTVQVEFGQLHGMSNEVSFELLRLESLDGSRPRVYKCSTWGSMGECLAYLLRRAIENRDAVSRTNEELRALRSEVRRRLWSDSSPASA